jgi:hypothetical protein
MPTVRAAAFAEFLLVRIVPGLRFCTSGFGLHRRFAATQRWVRCRENRTVGGGRPNSRSLPTALPEPWPAGRRASGAE